VRSDAGVQKDSSKIGEGAKVVSRAAEEIGEEAKAVLKQDAMDRLST
jgi:hypothetical protein